MTDERTWNWDKRQQKLIVDVKRTIIDKKAKRVIAIRETHNKEGALKVKMNLFQQLQALEKQKEPREKFLKDAERCKKLNARLKKLPLYQEIIDVLDGIKWEVDRQMQQQYIQAKQDEITYKRVKADFERVSKIVPTGKGK